MKKNMLLTLEVPEMEVVEFANSTDPGAAAQLIWVNNICLLVIVEFRDKATALNEARSFIDFRGRSFCPSEKQIIFWVIGYFKHQNNFNCVNTSQN